MYFHRVRVDSDTAKENIRRLFYQEECATVFFRSRYDSPADNPPYALAVKVRGMLEVIGIVSRNLLTDLRVTLHLRQSLHVSL